MIRSLLKLTLLSVAVFGFAGLAHAAGTVTGGFQGPEGQPVNATVRFLKGTDNITATASNGRFSQSLDPGEWSMTAYVADHPEYGAFTPFSIPRLRVDDGDNFDLGTLPVRLHVSSSDVEDLDDFQAPPEICFDNGGPIIIRSFFSDLKKGSFLYANRSAPVTVIADQSGYTVTADYSIYENNSPGTNAVTLTDNSDGTYTGSFTISNTQQGGGMVIFTVQDGEGNISRSCSDGGPLNLNIRDFLDGSDTSNFSAVDDFRAIENFTMHVDGVVKITMKKPVNMLDQNVQRFFKSIGRTFEHETGRMELNAKSAKMLQKAGAEVTFYNVPSQYISTPEILLDGAAAGSAVSGVTYDASAKTLTFSAAHFSEYKLAPKVTITAPKTGSSTGDQTVTMTGTINDLTGSLRFHVNGIDAGSAVPNSAGQFAKVVTLNKSGANTLSVVGCNTSACSSSQSVSVTYGATTSTAATTSSSSSSSSSVSSSSSSSTSATSSAALPKTGTMPWLSLTFLGVAVAGAGVLLAANARKRRA